MFDSVLQGLVLVVQWPAIGYLFVGVVLGLYFGAVPGLSGLTGMAILLPFTFGVEPVAAFALLLGMFAVTTTGDTISAVLLGVPGTSSAAATVLDGYPMARKGEAARAFGAAFTVSAIGGVLGAIMLGLSLPIVRPLIMSFANPEFFMLGVLGLAMVGSLSGDSIVKGLAAACLGVLISTIGFSPQGAMSRFSFDLTYLLVEGLPIVPVVLGLFAIPETVMLAASNTSISQVKREDVRSGLMIGVRDAFRHWWLVLRSSAIGVYIGLLPGMGGSIVDWVAYGHAVQSAKDKSGFGKGDVRGVIAPEAANNAVKGGSLIPTIAFGIPGSAGMALLLGAFLIQGLTPGPEMLTSKLDITFSLMWTLVIANIAGAVLLMIWSKHLSKVTFIPPEMIIPSIVLFVFMGAWMANTTMEDWYLMLIFGVVGLAMRAGGWPRAPLILGFVLGDIMETALDISIQSHGMSWIYSRPITAIIAVLAILTIATSALGIVKRRSNPNSVRIKAEATLPGEDTRYEPYVSAVLALILCTALVYALYRAAGWPFNVGLFPLTFGWPALVLVVLALAGDAIAIRRSVPDGAPGLIGAEYLGSLRTMAFRRTLAIFGWFFFVIGVTYLFGQLIAIPLFIACFLLAKGRGWKVAAIYAVAGWGVLYGMFERIIYVTWYPSLLGLSI